MEQWRTIPAFPDYEASTLGRIRRARANQAWRIGMIIRPIVTGTCGYPTVNLYRDGKMKTVLVHRMIAETFIGSPPDKTEVSHIDGNPRNNVAGNLTWETRKENAGRRRGHGTALVGEKSPLAKLNAGQVLEIRERRYAGEPLASLAKDFQVTETQISRIARRTVWSHI